MTLVRSIVAVFFLVPVPAFGGIISIDPGNVGETFTSKVFPFTTPKIAHFTSFFAAKSFKLIAITKNNTQIIAPPAATILLFLCLGDGFL